MLNAFGGERDASAYMITAALIAVVGALLMVIAGVKTKERIQPDKEVISVKQNIKTITVVFLTSITFLSYYLIFVHNFFIQSLIFFAQASIYFMQNKNFKRSINYGNKKI